MNKRPETQLITDRLAALGEAIRLRVLAVLEAQELSVGEVAKVVQLPQSTVSRHLKVLSDGGWLERRNHGTATFYRLVLDDLAPQQRALWIAVRDQMGLADEVAGDALRLRGVLAERALDSQAFFGRVAGAWDQVRNELFGDHFMAPTLLSLLPRGWIVADLGCGTGNVAELLAPCVTRVFAVDSSPAMLDAAKLRLADVNNVEFVEGELGRLPLADSSVDAAVLALVLHHLEDPGAAMREACRVLKPSGTALVVDMIAHDRAEYRKTMGHKHLGFAPEALRALFEDAGLNSVHTRNLPGDSAARGPGLVVAMGHRPADGRGSRRHGT
jgi:ubiquinone/menaquinone biosynthesis C-methylase UbiE/DNA-binding transcriptional ArsR family regulator